MRPEHGDALLSVEDLRVRFHTDAGAVRAVDGVSWSVRPGETLGIVGESGSGKSVSALAVLGLLPTPPADVAGAVRFRGHDLLRAGPRHLRSVRGREISMIFQDPLTALNPVFTIGHQVAEVISAHAKVGRLPARRRAVELLAEVGIPRPRQRAEDYPHRLSGGMRQRVMIAMSLALDPAVLLADEPTTALDVTVQAQIMELLNRLRRDRGTAVVLITHDLGLVAGHADRVLVMYAGRVVEVADVDRVFYAPRHAYTRGLLDSLTRVDRRGGDRLTPIPGQPPHPGDVPHGCAFAPRCRFATDQCRRIVPELTEQDAAGHRAACHHSGEVARSVLGRAHADEGTP